MHLSDINMHLCCPDPRLDEQSVVQISNLTAFGFTGKNHFFHWSSPLTDTRLHMMMHHPLANGIADTTMKHAQCFLFVEAIAALLPQRERIELVPPSCLASNKWCAVMNAQ